MVTSLPDGWRGCRGSVRFFGLPPGVSTRNVKTDAFTPPSRLIPRAGIVVARLVGGRCYHTLSGSPNRGSGDLSTPRPTPLLGRSQYFLCGQQPFLPGQVERICLFPPLLFQSVAS